jgi:hypothetical protein
MNAVPWPLVALAVIIDSDPDTCSFIDVPMERGFAISVHWKSTLAQLRASFGDADLHPSLHARAAALGVSLCKRS